MMDSNERQDEILLLEYLTGRLEAAQAEEVRARLAAEDMFRRRHDALAAVLGALRLSPEPESPPDLADRTLAKLACRREASAFLVMPPGGGAMVRPTFSLRELLAVAAALVVMAGLFVPAIQKARRKNLESLCAMQMGQIGNALQSHAINHDGRLPAARTGTSGDGWLPDGASPPASNSRALFCLLRERYVDSPVVFQCPGLGGSSFVLTPDLRDFPLPEHVSYSYQHSLRCGLCVNDPPVAARTVQMAILADQTPLFFSGAFHPERLEKAVSDNHPEGQNVLYLDGHVIWTTHSAVGVEGDHIFLAGSVRTYTGREQPAGPTDSFLLPAHGGK